MPAESKVGGGGRDGRISIYSPLSSLHPWASCLSSYAKMLYPWLSLLGPTLASFMVFSTMAHRYLPPYLRSHISRIVTRIVLTFNPYIEIKIEEYTGQRLLRSEAYSAIQAYLRKTTTKRAMRLKAESGRGEGKTKIKLFMDDHEQVTDEFRGAKLWWKACSRVRKTQTITFHPTEESRRFYTLSFHQRHRKMVVDEYLPHLLKEGKRIIHKSKQRKLYMNSRRSDGRGGISGWSDVIFEHPATFETLAMEPEKKQEIIQDLLSFSGAKDYYAKIGKAWKRGYLLYGPPGTGKSTMIAAMANFLEYNVYDLELTAVKDNTELRRLLIETTRKSIIVIEDIDCSIDLSGKREKKSEKEREQDDTDAKKKIKAKMEEEDGRSQVTLSGLLNFIDGLWSACGMERIIIFTTNYVEKLDPALIRRGRMDKHIEMSYCSFEGFKLLAKNYLDLDSHPLFEDIRQLMEGSKIAPADVAESLMPKSSILTAEENAKTCLEKLIQDLQKAKEEALPKAKEELMPVPEDDSTRQEPTTPAEENRNAEIVDAQAADDQRK